MEENTSEATHGPGWSTETADYLDKLWARHDAEKAEADQRLRLKEERKAMRKRKLKERSATDATSASCGKGQTPTVGRELRSRTIPESTLLVEATSEAIDDDHSSKRRRSDAATPTDVSDSHIDSHYAPPPSALLVDCHSTSPSERTTPPAPKTVATDACQNCGTTRSPEGLCYFNSTLASGWRICQACYAYERQHEKHRPPELEARLQSQVGLGGPNPEFKSSSASPSASVAISARASGPTVVPHQICSNCRAPTGSYVRPSALTPGWGICGPCNGYERRHKKHRPPELEAARQSRVAVNLGDAKSQCVNCHAGEYVWFLAL